jgi:class 3 adenylate cyclase
VGVEREGAFNFWRQSYPVFWIMLLSVAVLFAFYQYGRISKKAYYGKAPAESTSVKTAKYEAPIRLDLTNKKDVISEGKREECSVISLRIKNMEEVEKAKGSAMDALERALTRAKDANAKIYSDRGFKTIVFAPSLTSEQDNNMRAVRVANAIERVLSEHNQRFGEKIMFGIGVHAGEMIVESGKEGFKFNAIGNMMPNAKRIAETANYSVGVSEHVHRRVLGKVKSDKDGSGNFWRLRKVMDHEAHSDFISQFKDRNKFK